MKPATLSIDFHSEAAGRGIRCFLSRNNSRFLASLGMTDKGMTK